MLQFSNCAQSHNTLLSTLCLRFLTTFHNHHAALQYNQEIVALDLANFAEWGEPESLHIE
jgi:hypothetical protein